MHRCEIKDDTETGLMEPIDERHELEWIPITRVNAIEARSLITPGTIEWILGYRHYLDMGVTSFFQIRDKVIGDFFI